jgi:glycerophosphoryl diester phosphodiesterase
MRYSHIIATAAVAVLVDIINGKLSNAAFFYNKTRPLVLAHRGASGQFPEHTLGAYTSAYFYGADYVELDLQITKDGHIVTNHDPCLKETTNVELYHSKFGDRMGNWIFPPYDNVYTSDYLIHDFTLDELKLLRRKMRY